jgi:threonine/homoserine/homoserine lactone efflux protein
MEFPAWLSLATICILGAMSPGPSLAVVLKHCVAGSMSHGIVAAVSHGLAVGLYAIAAILGLSSLVVKFPVLYQVLVYGGAGYLFYMGYHSLTSRTNRFVSETDDKNSTSYRQAVMDSAAIAILNPKLAVFFTALFSQFITKDTANFYTSSIMVSTVAAIDMIWYSIVAVVISLAKHKVAFDQHTNIINKVSGVVFIGLALRVVTL